MWMYDFVSLEMNGIGLTIDRLEIYTFVGQTVHPQILSSDTLEGLDLKTVIPSRGDWSISGGLPVQEKVSDIGVALNVSKSTKLKRLIPCNNKLTKITLGTQKYLTDLDCSGNKGLKKLDLEGGKNF